MGEGDLLDNIPVIGETVRTARPQRHKNVFEWRNTQTIFGDLVITEHSRNPAVRPQSEVFALRRGLCFNRTHPGMEPQGYRARGQWGGWPQ